MHLSCIARTWYKHLNVTFIIIQINTTKYGYTICEVCIAFHIADLWPTNGVQSWQDCDLKYVCYALEAPPPLLTGQVREFPAQAQTHHSFLSNTKKLNTNLSNSREKLSLVFLKNGLFRINIYGVNFGKQRGSSYFRPCWWAGKSWVTLKDRTYTILYLYIYIKNEENWEHTKEGKSP